MSYSDRFLVWLVLVRSAADLSDALGVHALRADFYHLLLLLIQSFLVLMLQHSLLNVLLIYSAVAISEVFFVEGKLEAGNCVLVMF